MYRKSWEEKRKDAVALLEIIMRKKGVKSYLTNTFIPHREPSSYEEEWKRLYEVTCLAKKDAKNLAWVMTCPRPWDSQNKDSKPYLSGNCTFRRMWDNFGETTNRILRGFMSRA